MSVNNLKTLKNLIYRYGEQKGIELAVDCYLYGNQMIASGERYSIVFIGHNLYRKNCFEIAKAVKKYNRLTAIVFISSDVNLAVEGYKVDIFRFLKSPVGKSDFFGVLDEYFEKNGNNYPLLLKSGVDTVCLNTAEILYLEANNKRCLVHLPGETLVCNRTMARVYDDMPKNHFIKINRAYIINSDYVNRYNNDVVILKNGQQLHISRGYLSEFKQSYSSIFELRHL